ncbi:hypothetical protein [Nocardia sp. NBC_01377]|uniref:hypothetical protein n=1 Tax=Nocardia sp. NBC_01377 TaxID=2903595 RepID=UPI00386ABF14
MSGYRPANAAENYDNDTAAEKPGYQIPQRASFVDVEVGEDRLPTVVHLGRSWGSSYTPSEYAASIMKGYRYALYERLMKLIDSGGSPAPVQLPLRQIVPALLQTRSYEEYVAQYKKLFGVGECYVAHGRDRNEFDEVVLTIRASRVELTEIWIDPQWAASVDSFTIAHDIVECADQIRSMKPALQHDMYLDQETDDELFTRLTRHQWYLLGNENL